MARAHSLFESRILNSPEPDKPAIISEGQGLSYRELALKTSSLVAYFESKGLREGQRLAVLLPNSLEFLLCYLASLLGGYTMVPISPTLPEQTIKYILEVSRPPLVIRRAEDLEYPEVPPLSSMRGLGVEVSYIFFTSGTTGMPKGVCHSAASMIENVVEFNELAGLGQSVRMLHVMPMGYMAGFLNTVLSPLMAGGTVIIAPQFNALQAMHFWKPAMEQGANALWISPTMAAFIARLNRSAEVPRWTADNLKHVLVGTAPLPKATRESFESLFGVRCLESYGMTEVLLISGNSPLFETKDCSVGRLVKGVHIETRDSSGKALSPAEPGHLYIRTPYIMEGYLDPATGAVDEVKAGRVLDTGDYGHLDPEGYLFITGRTKDILIHGGTNVSPRAVEESLLRHPDIADVAVLGTPHPFWGDEVAACLIMAEGKAFDKESIVAFCKETLPPDAVPTVFRVLEEFPRSSTGKVQKHLLAKSL